MLVVEFAAAAAVIITNGPHRSPYCLSIAAWVFWVGIGAKLIWIVNEEVHIFTWIHFTRLLYPKVDGRQAIDIKDVFRFLLP